MIAISADDFESLVNDELDALPLEMLAGLDNVVIMIEDEPEDGSDLLGVYEGLALTERDNYAGVLPDRIVLFRGPLTRMCTDINDLKDEIHITLVHEIAHFYGIEEDQLHHLGWG